MNIGGLSVIGMGIFVTMMGYLADEDKTIMLIGAFIILLGFGALTVKNRSINKKTGTPFYKCPNCGSYAGEESSKAKEIGKTYRCISCDYKW